MDRFKMRQRNISSVWREQRNSILNMVFPRRTEENSCLFDVDAVDQKLEAEDDAKSLMKVSKVSCSSPSKGDTGLEHSDDHMENTNTSIFSMLWNKGNDQLQTVDKTSYRYSDDITEGNVWNEDREISPQLQIEECEELETSNTVECNEAYSRSGPSNISPNRPGPINICWGGARSPGPIIGDVSSCPLSSNEYKVQTYPSNDCTPERTNIEVDSRGRTIYSVPFTVPENRLATREPCLQDTSAPTAPYHSPQPEPKGQTKQTTDHRVRFHDTPVNLDFEESDLYYQSTSPKPFNIERSTRNKAHMLSPIVREDVSNFDDDIDFLRQKAKSPQDTQLVANKADVSTLGNQLDDLPLKALPGQFPHYLVIPGVTPLSSDTTNKPEISHGVGQDKAAQPTRTTLAKLQSETVDTRPLKSPYKLFNCRRSPILKSGRKTPKSPERNHMTMIKSPEMETPLFRTEVTDRCHTSTDIADCASPTRELNLINDIRQLTAVSPNTHDNGLTVRFNLGTPEEVPVQNDRSPPTVLITAPVDDIDRRPQFSMLAKNKQLPPLAEKPENWVDSSDYGGVSCMDPYLTSTTRLYSVS